MAEKNDVLLDVAGLSKSFGALAAVEDMSFSLAPGEILGIAGPNGAGKTTLFNLITGAFFHADQGTVTFRGQRIESMAPHKIFKLGLARTFQKETAFANLTVEQNIKLGATFGAGLRGKELSLALDRTAERLNLSDQRSQPASSLNVYELKRLMLASAVVTSPAMLMLDEPASGLTAAEVQDLQALILGFRDEGMSILLIEHILPLLFGLSQRVMVMDFGRKLAEGRPADIVRNPQVIEAYLGGQSEAAHALAG